MSELKLQVVIIPVSLSDVLTICNHRVGQISPVSSSQELQKYCYCYYHSTLAPPINSIVPLNSMQCCILWFSSFAPHMVCLLIWKQINMKRGESKTAIHEASELETTEQCCHNIRTLETEQSRLSDTTRPGHWPPTPPPQQQQHCTLKLEADTARIRSYLQFRWPMIFLKE